MCTKDESAHLAGHETYYKVLSRFMHRSPASLVLLSRVLNVSLVMPRAWCESNVIKVIRYSEKYIKSRPECRHIRPWRASHRTRRCPCRGLVPKRSWHAPLRPPATILRSCQLRDTCGATACRACARRGARTRAGGFRHSRNAAVCGQSRSSTPRYSSPRRGLSISQPQRRPLGCRWAARALQR